MGAATAPGRIADRDEGGDDRAGHSNELHAELLGDRDGAYVRETFGPAAFKNSKCLHEFAPV
jgi:hypothetical protein